MDTTNVMRAHNYVTGTGDGCHYYYASLRRRCGLLRVEHTTPPSDEGAVNNLEAASPDVTRDHTYVSGPFPGCYYYVETTNHRCGRLSVDHFHVFGKVPPKKGPDITDNDLIPAVQAWDAYSAQVRELIMRKSQGYGNAWEEQGYMGNLARVMSKVSRVKNMMWRDPGDEEWGTGTAFDESVMDTLRDLGALAALTIANIDDGNRWGRK